ncbi:hypothetical protein BSL78_18778, partial [Apostichopus japonicus]
FIFRNQIANLTKSLYLPNSQYNPTKLIEAQRNPVQHLSVEFLKGIQENGEIILTCSGLYIPPRPTNIKYHNKQDYALGIVFYSDCEENTFQTTIKVIGADQRDNLLQRGFNCTQTEPIILRRYTCVACAQGSYTSLQGREVCIPCPRGGFYQDEVGQFQRLPNVIACNNCNNGTFVPKEEASALSIVRFARRVPTRVDTLGIEHVSVWITTFEEIDSVVVNSVHKQD